MDKVTVLFLGDVVGRPGRRVLKAQLPALKNRFQADLIIANGENAAGGKGLDEKCSEELFAAGVDVITGGNHSWQQKDFYPYLKSNSSRVIRPHNYPMGAPGCGWTKIELNGGQCVGIANFIGRIFLSPLVDCPFRSAQQLFENELAGCSLSIVDFHAEATSEKVAMGCFLDGKVSAVLGTHTHVQTADARILPGGTAYLSDVGMCGPQESVIGVRSDFVLAHFLSALPPRFDVAKGPVQLNGVVLRFGGEPLRALAIERVYESYPEA